MRQRGIIGFSGFGGDEEEATVCPSGQYGVPPFCFEPSSWLPGGAEAGEASYGQCPEGTIGIPPNCVAIPQEIPPLPTSQCPEGTIGIPPNCVAISQLPQLPPATPTQCPTGQSLDPTTKLCVQRCPDPATHWDEAAGQCVQLCSAGWSWNTQTRECEPLPGTEVAPVNYQRSWWAQRSDTEKGLIIGGAVLGGIGLLFLLKRAASPSYATNEGEPAPEPEKQATPNRRKRGRRRSPKA